MIVDKEFECVKVDFSEFGEEIGILRRKAWTTVEGFDAKVFPNKVWMDKYDIDAVHFAMFHEGKIIAASRVGVYHKYGDIPYINMMEQYKSYLELPVGSFNRLVIDQSYRGKNISKMFDEVRIAEAKKLGCKTIVGQAVRRRIAPLKKIGFEYIADIGSYDVLPNVELSMMVKHL